MRLLGFSLGIMVLLCCMAPTLHAQTITLWEHEQSDVQEKLDQILAGFEKANPGIKVKRSHYKTEDLRTQFQTAVMGGSGGDVVLGPNDFGGPFSVMGVIQPIDKQIDLSRFSPDVVDAVRGDGKVWGIPVSKGNHLMMFVNKKILKSAPVTLEDLIKVGKTVTDEKKKTYGLAYNLNEPFFFVPFMGAFGGRPLEDTKPALDGPAMVGALDFVKDLKFKEKIVPSDCDYSCAETLFLEGQVAMLINGDWALAKYREKYGDDLIVAPLPKLAKTGKYMEPMISGKYLFLNRMLTGKKLEAAKKLAAYLTADEQQVAMAKDWRRLPAVKTVVDSKTIQDDKVLHDTLMAAQNGQPMPMATEMRAVWDAIRPQLQAVMAGRTGTKEAASIMQKDAENKIKAMLQ